MEPHFLADLTRMRQTFLETGPDPIAMVISPLHELFNVYQQCSYILTTEDMPDGGVIGMFLIAHPLHLF